MSTEEQNVRSFTDAFQKKDWDQKRRNRTNLFATTCTHYQFIKLKQNTTQIVNNHK